MALEPEGNASDAETAAALSFAGATRHLGSYEVQEEIGRGGMGIIYRAVHRATGEVVALKTVLPQFRDCAETVARFRREAEAASSLDHPHSIPIREVGQGPDGVPFFSMKLAVGGSLHQLTEKYRGRWRQIAQLMVKISSAVHYAHERGLLHRDLKPGNILFTEDHEPMVTDFGLVKQFVSTENLTQSCAILGTPNYLAPEHAAGFTADPTRATDIYSLGAVFFELLTGRPPFVGNNALEVLRQVSELSPPNPSRFAPSVPRVLETICKRCLERRPQDRYVSAQELVYDLDQWLKGKKVVQVPLRVWWRGKLRRHTRLLAGVGSVSLLILVLILGVEIARHRGDDSERAIPVALMMEDLSQDTSLGPIVDEVTSQLKKALTKNKDLQIVDASSTADPLSAAALQPLVYARSLNAQGVIAGSVRKVGGHLKLTVRFLYHNSPDALWQGRESVSVEQILNTLPAACERIAAALPSPWRADSAANLRKSSAIAVLPEAMVFYDKARELATCRNEKDMREAAALFRRAVDLDPHFVAARGMLAYSLWTLVRSWEERDNLPLAIANAKMAIAQDANEAMALRVIANCLFDDGRYAEALDEFLNVAESNPQSAGCNLSIGECLREMGHPEQALPWLEKAMRLEPAHGVFSKAFAETLMLVSSDNQAIAALQHAADLEPDQPEPMICLSVLRTWQKRFGEAAILCAQTKQHFPDYRYRLNVAAMVEFFSGDAAAARADYQTLREQQNFQRGWECYGAVNPSSALAWIAKQAGDSATARTMITEAIEMDQRLLLRHPRNSRILHDLAATYAVAEDFPKALDHLAEAIAAGWTEHRSTEIDPRFRLLANNPTFVDLLERTRPKALETKGPYLALGAK